MAGVIGICTAAERACAAATKQTLLQIKNGANHRAKILSWGVSCDGVSGTAEPITVELIVQNTAGTSSAGTTVKQNLGDAETLVTNCLAGFSSTEPTTTSVIQRVSVHPQGGYQETLPFGQEILVGGASADTTRVGIAVTVPTGGATINVVPFFRFEE